MTVNIPDFGKYINLFISSSGYTFTGFIQYPAFYSNGEPNILNIDSSTHTIIKGYYCVLANLPLGSNLRVVFKKVTGIPYINQFDQTSSWIYTYYGSMDSLAVQVVGTNALAFRELRVLTIMTFDICIYENEGNPLLYRYRKYTVTTQ